MKVLIIGANGFLGTSILNKCLEKKWEVSVLITNRGSKLDSRISQSFIFPDVEKCEEISFDVVINVAAKIPYGSMDVISKELIESNIMLPIWICEKFAKSRIIHTSSVSVYGDVCGKISTDSPTSATNSYGLSKLLSEKAFQEHNNTAIFRISSMYGAEMKANGIIHNYVKSAKLSGEIVVFGKGNRLQDYIHVEDVADLLLLACTSCDTGNFNLCYGLSFTNLQLATIIKQKVGNTKIIFSGSDSSPSKEYNIQKTIESFEFRPAIGLEEGIEKLI